MATAERLGTGNGNGNGNGNGDGDGTGYGYGDALLCTGPDLSDVQATVLGVVFESMVVKAFAEIEGD